MDTSTTFFRLPRSLYHCKLGNFQWDAVTPKKLRSTIETYITQVIAGGNQHLILTGYPGIGKSHLSVSAYRCVVYEVGTMLTTWINVPSFCDTVKAAYNDTDWDPLDDIREARRFVVLDDLFGRYLTSHETLIITRILDIVYNNDAALMVTMNYAIDELPGMLHTHEVSRLTAHSTIVSMKGEDWRAK